MQLRAALLTIEGIDPAAVHMLEALRDALEPHLGAGRRDPVSGLGSRRQYMERLAEGGVASSLCLFELDSDAPPGDAVRAVATVMRGVRDGDLAFRPSELQFALLLPGTPLVGARVVGERLADRIATDTPLTASYGAADSSAGDPRGLHEAAVADLAARRRRLAPATTGAPGPPRPAGTWAG